MALAYRIYCYANPRGWDCTATEVADAIRSTPQAVRRVSYLKGWGTRFRVTPSWGATAVPLNEGMFDGGTVKENIAHLRPPRRRSPRITDRRPPCPSP
jgi:hypothetical protein